MFQRSLLKQTAKRRLERNGRWFAVLLTLIGSFSGVTVSSPSVSFSFPSSEMETTFSAFSPPDLPPYFGIVAVAISIFLCLLATSYSIFLGNVYRVGMTRWFLQYTRDDTKSPSIRHVLHGFRYYGRVVVTMLLKDLYIGLWSLLFIIPGVVKSYSYYMVPYLLADNPHLTPKQALEISQACMQGWRWKTFVFELSFIGWHLLNFITFGIVGVLYFYPLRNTAYAYYANMITYDALYVRRVVDPNLISYTPPSTAASY